MVGYGFVDEVAGYLDDVNTLMMNLQRSVFILLYIDNMNDVMLKKQKLTIAVSSRAMSRVPVTNRKMIKILMILSSERSSHTTIWVHGGRPKAGPNRRREMWEGGNNREVIE